MSKPPFPSQFPQPGARPPGQTAGKPGGGIPLGMIAMICGLLSLVMGCPLSIAAIILGLVGLKKEPKGMATAGLVLGIVTLTLNVVVGCFILALYGMTLGAVASVATNGPASETSNALQEAAAKIEASKRANHSYPDEATGTSMVAGTNDGWGNQIVYRLDGTDYVLVSLGADGVLDTDDDVLLNASEYDLAAAYGGAHLETGGRSWGETERSLGEAIEIIDDHALYSTSAQFPEDEEGQRLIDHLTDEWGNNLVYRQTEGGEWYRVITKGGDGILGTRDDYSSETDPYAQ